MNQILTLITVTFFAIGCWELVSGQCSECLKNSVTCTSETTFTVCFQGVEITDVFTCPEGMVCTSDEEICKENCGNNPVGPSCVNRGGKCQYSKGRAMCLNSTSFSFCSVNDCYQDDSVGHCDPGLYCDPGEEEVCTSLVELSCYVDREVLYQIYDDTTTIITTELTTMSSTPDSSTEPQTPELSTLDTPTPEPSTDTSESSTPEPTTPGISTPEPTTFPPDTPSSELSTDTPTPSSDTPTPEPSLTTESTTDTQPSESSTDTPTPEATTTTSPPPTTTTVNTSVPTKSPQQMCEDQGVNGSTICYKNCCKQFFRCDLRGTRWAAVPLTCSGNDFYDHAVRKCVSYLPEGCCYY